MHDLPGSLRLTSTFPFVGRSAELETLRALMPRAEGEGRRVVLLGGEPGSGKSRLVREFAARGGRRRRARPLRRLRRGRAHALRAVRRGARPPRAGRPSRPSCAPRSGTGGRRAHAAAARPGRRGSASCRRRSRPTPTPSATACTPRSPTCSPASAAAGRCCSCSRTATGPTRRRCCSCATWRARPAARGVLLLATFRDTEADVPATLSETLADLRRSDDVVRLRLDGPLRRRGRPSSSGAPAGGDAGAGLPELAQRDQRPHRRQRVPGLRAVARAGRDRRGGGRRRARSGSPRPPAELGTPESVREVVSQRLSRLAPGTTDLLELAATAGPEFELDVVRRAAGLAEPELLARARRGRAQRDDRGAARRARWPTASRTSSCGGRSTTGCRGVRRAELHLRVGEALERADGRAPAARSPTSRTTSPPPRRSAAPSAAVDYNVLRRAGGHRRARLRRGGGAAAHGARAAGSTTRSERAEMLLELGTASHRAGKALDALDAFAAAAEIARELGDARAARARGDRLRGRLLAPGDRRPGRGRAARGGDRRARRRELRAARRPARRARPRARLPGRPRARRDRARQRDRRWRGGSTTAPGSRRC